MRITTKRSRYSAPSALPATEINNKCDRVSGELGEIMDKSKLQDFIDNLCEIMNEASTLLVSKQEDYGPSNISKAPGGALNGLRVRMHDKIERINHIIDSGQDPNHESLRDSFIDLANYGLIALMVIDGKWPNE
jgi:hypothetical protein